MPKVRLDWNQLLYDAGESTTGWEVEMHIRTAAGVSPAVAAFSTADGTLTVGQPTSAGIDYGISASAEAADMDFEAGTYVLDLVRTDGSRKEDLLDGDVIQWTFIAPVTEPGVP